jgi:hypothetical protein
MINPTQRDRDTIISMLQQFRAAQETLLRSGDTPRGGDRAPLRMPQTWTPEMRELERCLALLAYRKPKVHRHVMARHVDPILSRRTMVGRATKRGGTELIIWPQLGPCAEVRTSAKLPEHKGTSVYSCLLASWPAWVNKPTVEAGIDTLVRWYEPPTASVGPALPLEMVAA